MCLNTIAIKFSSANLFIMPANLMNKTGYDLPGITRREDSR